MGRKFGYARVSTNQQCLDIQMKILIEAGVEEHRIMTDKATGKNMERDGLQKLLIKVEKGDVIYVTRLDRLGRNTLEMCLMINEFKTIGVGIRFLLEGLSTDGTMGEMMITMLAAVAQAERERTMERIKEGHVAALAKGVKYGPKFKIKRKELVDLWKNGTKAAEIAKQLKIGPASVYRVLKEEKLKVENKIPA